MTDDVKEIKEKTGCGIGKVFLGEKCYEPQNGDNTLFNDERNGDFHLYPQIEEFENQTKWKNFFEYEKELLKKIKNELTTIPEITEKEIKIGNGSLCGINDYYINHDLNRFYRYLEITKSRRSYVVLCRRYYIDEEDNVNCKYGFFQFYTTCSKNGCPNEKKGDKWIVNYPREEIDQKRENISSLVGDNKANMFNPHIEDFPVVFNEKIEDDKIDKCAKNVAKAFGEYFRIIEKLSS